MHGFLGEAPLTPFLQTRRPQESFGCESPRTSLRPRGRVDKQRRANSWPCRAQVIGCWAERTE